MVGPSLLYGKLQYQQWSSLAIIRMNWTQVDKFSFKIIALQLPNLEAFSSVYFMIDPKFSFLYCSLTYDIGLLWKNIFKAFFKIQNQNYTLQARIIIFDFRILTETHEDKVILCWSKRKLYILNIQQDFFLSWNSECYIKKQLLYALLLSSKTWLWLQDAVI